MFLLGTYAGKRQLFQHIQQHLRWIKNIAVWTLLIGMITTVAGFVYEAEPQDSLLFNLSQFISNYLGGASFGIFYSCAVVLLLQQLNGRKILTPLAAVGQMAATNYIMQSVICVVIFYSFGLGLYGKPSPITGIWITIALYIVQVRISNWWMAWFSYDPVEWIWRTLTYGKAMPIKRQKLSSQYSFANRIVKMGIGMMLISFVAVYHQLPLQTRNLSSVITSSALKI
jgi:uncharacterized protein